ncbi:MULTISPECIES: PRC-barrel domain-containing protein [unclassified Yoonia]|uniref:PRC-barrel domain-containing protein n=1 Tax=unclassified Yoonia TaxID=2629118 RepID=UPI002AFE362B|nr:MULTISPECIES: PRC-barrel domain-containing protein [unclassified Yoonia]
MTDHNTPAQPSTIGGAFSFNREGYGHVETHALTTNDVENAYVYGRDDETIGSISNLEVGADGKITHAIVDVGGFLGMGAHSVKLPFSDLTVLRETNGADLRIHLDTTAEQLKAMPQYHA